jgi:small subunit ribosomal protein S18
MSDETQVKPPAAADGSQQPASGQGSAPGAGARGARPAGGPGSRGKFFRRKKVCKFCTEKIDAIPYRDICTTHQRRLTRAIKQARNIALLPFATRH